MLQIAITIQQSAEFRTSMGALAVLIMLAAYGSQLWTTYRKETEPHPISWLGFGFLTTVGFLVQLQKDAGPGSWVMGVTAFFCFLIGAMSLYRKEWRLADFDVWDWRALGAGIVLLGLYFYSYRFSWGPLLSAALAALADSVLYVPIFRRVRLLPWKENIYAYLLNSLKFVPSLAAMSTYSYETCLYPAAMIVMNAAVVWYLRRRRKGMPA